MNKKKNMLAGFAIFAAMLMLIGTGLTSIKAAQSTKQTATQTKPAVGDGCLILLMAYEQTKKALENPNLPPEEIAILKAAQEIILDTAKDFGCLWVRFDYSMPSSKLIAPMTSQPVAQTTRTATSPIQTSPLQSSSSSQTTCSLCAAK